MYRAAVVTWAYIESYKQSEMIVSVVSNMLRNVLHGDAHPWFYTEGDENTLKLVTSLCPRVFCCDNVQCEVGSDKGFEVPPMWLYPKPYSRSCGASRVLHSSWPRCRMLHLQCALHNCSFIWTASGAV